ncbi:hypothetical protein HDU96_003354 [Phlyctochytrium bullatum]|nr:hypothetical protein HDU96_003354 [Phlyctochytrium bullatum]
MFRARAILDLVLQRETLRKESLMLEKAAFDKRILLRKLKKEYGFISGDKEIEASPDSKKKKRKLHEEQRTKIKIPLQKLKDAAAFASDTTENRDRQFVENGVGTVESLAKRKKIFDERSGWLDLSESSFRFERSPAPFLWTEFPGPFFGATAEVAAKGVLGGKHAPGHVGIRTRARFGRGGRLCFDRRLKLPPSEEFAVSDESEDDNYALEVNDDLRYLLSFG